MSNSAYRIKDWPILYENNRTRELKRLDWVPVPNRMDGDGYTELLDHPDGASHLGAWLAIIQIASRCDPRGTLLREGGRPHDFHSLSRISRIPEKVFAEVIPRLLHIGWLEDLTVRGFIDMRDASQEGAGKPQDDAAKSQEGALNGREWKGMEGNGKKGPVVVRSTPEWKLDESFVAFREDYLRTSGPFIDKDFLEAYQWVWRTLDFEQRQVRHAALKRHLDQGAWENPRFVPKPQKFLDSDWERPILPKVGAKPPSTYKQPVYFDPKTITGDKPV